MCSIRCHVSSVSLRYAVFSSYRSSLLRFLAFAIAPRTTVLSRSIVAVLAVLAIAHLPVCCRPATADLVSLARHHDGRCVPGAEHPCSLPRSCGDCVVATHGMPSLWSCSGSESNSKPYVGPTATRVPNSPASQGRERPRVPQGAQPPQRTARRCHPARRARASGLAPCPRCEMHASFRAAQRRTLRGRAGSPARRSEPCRHLRARTPRCRHSGTGAVVVPRPGQFETRHNAYAPPVSVAVALMAITSPATRYTGPSTEPSCSGKGALFTIPTSSSFPVCATFPWLCFPLSVVSKPPPEHTQRTHTSPHTAPTPRPTGVPSRYTWRRHIGRKAQSGQRWGEAWRAWSRSGSSCVGTVRRRG